MSSSFSSKQTVVSFCAGVVGAALTLTAGGFILAQYPEVFSTWTKLGNLGQGSESMTVVSTPVPETSVVSVVKKANPAVVSIVISKDVPIIEKYYEQRSADPRDPFSQFFGGGSPFSFQVPRYRQNGTEKKEVGGGSGFLISADGYIVTNRHVVSQDNVDYTVFTNDGKKFPAKVIASDDILDIALIKIETQDMPYLSFGDSQKMELGETVVAIGNALAEFRNTVSVGVVSGLSRTIIAGDGMGNSEQLQDLIQTDAAINPGNSGGPLLNTVGDVIGVNVAMADGSENIGFALPSNLVKSAVESMKTNGKVVRPYLGVRLLPVNSAIAKQNHLPVEYGVLVVRGENPGDLAVIPGSPADKAGIEENDLITEFDGQKIDDEHALPNFVRQKKVGDKVKLKIWHDGKEREEVVTLEELK